MVRIFTHSIAAVPDHHNTIAPTSANSHDLVNVCLINVLYVANLQLVEVSVLKYIALISVPGGVEAILKQGSVFGVVRILLAKLVFFRAKGYFVIIGVKLNGNRNLCVVKMPRVGRVEVLKDMASLGARLAKRYLLEQTISVKDAIINQLRMSIINYPFASSLILRMPTFLVILSPFVGGVIPSNIRGSLSLFPCLICSQPKGNTN